jgi:hypothetical protein
MILADQAKPTKNVADLIIRHVFSFMRQSNVAQSRRSRYFLRAKTQTP